MKEIIYDIEVYKNKNCVGVLCNGRLSILDTPNKIKKLPIHNNNYLFIGFNNRRYDHPILEQMAQGRDASAIYELSQKIVNNEMNVISWAKNIVDLYEICPKMSQCSLKEFGHRLKYPILQNLPYSYDKVLTEEEWEVVKQYNVHDINIIKLLWDKLKEEYTARQGLKRFFDINTEYGGAPRLAEKAILSQLGDGRVSTPTNKLVKQSNLILSPELQAYYDEAFSWSVQDYIDKKPSFMDKKINVNGCDMSIQTGGLHGNTYTGVYNDVYEYDVTSYYPSIILNCQLGTPQFRAIYKKIYDRRLTLKEEKAPGAASLKLVLNSLYGKFKDRYADKRIYAPNLALTICLLGQFYMLDLIEKLEYEQCLMVNTDGVMCTHPIHETILKDWENRTGFKLTPTWYPNVILKDVNNYLGMTAQGPYKCKGDFLTSRWTHNVKPFIIQYAVLRVLRGGPPTISIADTICNPDNNIYDYCFFTKVTGDKKLLLNGEPLADPKVRYFMSNKGDVLERQSDKMRSRIVKNSKITLAMNLNDTYTDINYDWYINEANKLLERIRCRQNLNIK